MRCPEGGVTALLRPCVTPLAVKFRVVAATSTTDSDAERRTDSTGHAPTTDLYKKLWAFKSKPLVAQSAACADKCAN